MYTYESKNKQKYSEDRQENIRKQKEDGKRNLPKSVSLISFKRGTSAPIQCYSEDQLRDDFLRSKFDNIAREIPNCSKDELDHFFPIIKQKLNENFDGIGEDCFATIVSHLIARQNKTGGSPAAYNELIRILEIQLHNKGVALNMIDQDVLILEKSRSLTDYDLYRSWATSSSTGGTGSWNTIRGAGAYRYATPPASASVSAGSTPVAYGSATITADGKPPAGATDFPHTAVAEENLINPGSSYNTYTMYNKGYSITTHEFAHSIHEFGISDQQRVRIKNCYDQFLTKREPREWVDGPENSVTGGPCYASTNVKEYFAQSSNAYLGTNTGEDRNTGMPRHNGRKWLEDNDNDMLTLLDEIYGQTSTTGTTPIKTKYVNPCDMDGKLTGGTITNPGGS